MSYLGDTLASPLQTLLLRSQRLFIDHQLRSHHFGTKSQPFALELRIPRRQHLDTAPAPVNIDTPKWALDTLLVLLHPVCAGL